MPGNRSREPQPPDRADTSIQIAWTVKRASRPCPPYYLYIVLILPQVVSSAELGPYSRTVSLRKTITSTLVPTDGVDDSDAASIPRRSPASAGIKATSF